MAVNNSTASIALNQERAAAFGVVLNADGSLQTLKVGQFDAGQADDIARNLILLASSIRCAARAAIFPQ